MGFISWACRTPQRLAGVIGAPVLALIVIGSLWSGGGSDANGQVGTSGGLTPSVNAQVPDATPFVRAAVNFVNVWGRLAPGQSPDEWHDAVRALSTPELAAALDATDPHSLPSAESSGRPTVMDVTATDAIVAIPMTDGRQVIVTVVSADGKSWLARDIQPYAGN